MSRTYLWLREIVAFWWRTVVVVLLFGAGLFASWWWLYEIGYEKGRADGIAARQPYEKGVSGSVGFVIHDTAGLERVMTGDWNCFSAGDAIYLEEGEYLSGSDELFTRDEGGKIFQIPQEP
jgi:hypothetical protein